MSQTPPSPHHVLAVDTSSHIQSVALLAGNEVLYHLQHRIKFNHGSSLLTLLDAMLPEHGLSVKSLDLLVIGAGPGSFTGLRVGMATLKGLARAANVPLVSASSLESMAYACARTSPGVPVCAAVDARKKEVYAGVFISPDGEHLRTLSEEQTHSPDAFKAHLEGFAKDHARVILVERQLERYKSLEPDAWSHEKILRPGFSHAPVDGVAMAMLGRQRFMTEGASDLATLEPNYIRPSDAEISAAKKAAASERSHPDPA